MIKIDNEKATLDFGTGDIGINTFVMLDGSEEKGIIFYNQEPREIGTQGDIKAGSIYENINDFPIKMKFSRLESIDAVINSLEDLKKLYLENQ